MHCENAHGQTAERPRTGVREWDIVARIGGEEFCVIAPGLDSEEAVTRSATGYASPSPSSRSSFPPAPWCR